MTDAKAATRRKSGRKLVRDIAWNELRNGRIRMALAVLIWPPGWAHTRLEDDGR